jgi:hypothetical protein
LVKSNKIGKQKSPLSVKKLEQWAIRNLLENFIIKQRYAPFSFLIDSLWNQMLDQMLFENWWHLLLQSNLVLVYEF